MQRSYALTLCQNETLIKSVLNFNAERKLRRIEDKYPSMSKAFAGDVLSTHLVALSSFSSFDDMGERIVLLSSATLSLLSLYLGASLHADFFASTVTSLSKETSKQQIPSEVLVFAVNEGRFLIGNKVKDKNKIDEENIFAFCQNEGAKLLANLIEDKYILDCFSKKLSLNLSEDSGYEFDKKQLIWIVKKILNKIKEPLCPVFFN